MSNSFPFEPSNLICFIPGRLGFTEQTSEFQTNSTAHLQWDITAMKKNKKFFVKTSKSHHR